MADGNRDDYSEQIALALATPGGHLDIGRGGYTLHYRSKQNNMTRASGGNVEALRAQAIAAGLPVIDTRSAPFREVTKMVLRGPMAAVGDCPVSPKPWGPLDYCSLADACAVWRDAGADVFNAPDVAAQHEG